MESSFFDSLGMYVAPHVDASDPVVVGVSWLLTLVVSRVVQDGTELKKIRHFLPLIALCFAIGARVAIDAFQTDVSFATFLRAFASAAAAVLAHSQVREFEKMRKPDDQSSPKN
jgi:hypothetical protein